MNKIELTDMECKLIEEALTNSSVRYSCDAYTTEKSDPEWSKKMSDKADAMMKLLNKFDLINIYNN